MDFRLGDRVKLAAFPDCFGTVRDVAEYIEVEWDEENEANLARRGWGAYQLELVRRSKHSRLEDIIL